jgi:hypothetical protein
MPVNSHEQAIRDAALVLRDAIAAGEAIGLRVDFPRYAKDLGGIAISETKRFAAASEIAAFVDSRRGQAKPFKIKKS